MVTLWRYLFSFALKLMFLVYFAALDNDPLYLFTEEKIENYLSHFFEQHMKPALLYLQETFSPPIGLDHAWTPPLTDATDPDDIKMKSPNFKYQIPELCKTSSSNAWVSITEPFKKNPSHKNSWMAMIKVKVPKMRNHSFWETDSENFTSVPWDVDSNNVIEFEVSRWGASHQHANYYATHRAKDIIRHIRLALMTGFPVHPNFIPSSLKNNMQTCRVFQFGVKISKMWREAERAFTDNTREFWETALDKLRSFQVELPELQFLIKYYEVPFFSIEFSSQTFLLMQMDRFEDAIRLLTHLQVDLMSKENNMLSSKWLRLSELIEKRLSQRELVIAVQNRTSITMVRSSVETFDRPPVTREISDSDMRNQARTKYRT